jgi:nicotinate phosphoribosyltransferase
MAPALKVSETPEKTLNPGDKEVWRIYGKDGKATADCLSLREENLGNAGSITLHHPIMETKRRILKKENVKALEPLLGDVLVNGKIVTEQPTIEQMRSARDNDLAKLDAGVKRFIQPHTYHVSLSEKLWNLKRELTEKIGADVR